MDSSKRSNKSWPSWPEVFAAEEQIIALSAEEQLAFWNALIDAAKLTDAQQRLGAVMRGKS